MEDGETGVSGVYARCLAEVNSQKAGYVILHYQLMEVLSVEVNSDSGEIVIMIQAAVQVRIDQVQWFDKK